MQKKKKVQKINNMYKNLTFPARVWQIIDTFFLMNVNILKIIFYRRKP